MTSSFKMGFLDKQLIQRVNAESYKMSLKHLVPENEDPVKDNSDSVTRLKSLEEDCPRQRRDELRYTETMNRGAWWATWSHKESDTT